MTAAALSPTVSSATPSLTQAMFRAQSKASSITAVYVIGSGAWLAVALLALAHGHTYAHLFHWPSVVAVAVALLWLALGGNVMHKQLRKVRRYTAQYEAHMQHQMQMRLARKVASLSSCETHTLSSGIKYPLVRTTNVRPKRPVSLFGAYL